MTLSFRDKVALAALPALIGEWTEPTSTRLFEARIERLAHTAFDIADAMEVERQKRTPGPMSFSAGDSDIDLGDEPAEESLGPLVGIDTDTTTKNARTPVESGWREFSQTLEDRKADETSPRGPRSPKGKP